MPPDPVSREERRQRADDDDVAALIQERHDLRSRLEGVEAERDEANEALRECVRLTGDDVSDGFPTWPPLHEHAVQEVRRLREESDECPTPEDLQAAEARAERAEEALNDLREAANEYLAGQNFGGYKDGNYGHDEGCREARATLCGVLYPLNEAVEALASLASHPEERDG